MKKTAEQISQEHQTLTDHLTDLRVMLMRCFAGVFIAAIACYNYSESIFSVLRRPIEPFLQGNGLIFTGVTDKFMAHIKVSIIAGIILSIPYIIYQIWGFVAPGLYAKEKKYTLGFIISGTFLFLCGVLFAYFVVYPIAFEFLMNFGGTQDKPLISINEYLSFIAITSLLFGVSFELPLVIVILGMLGIVSQKFLREKRRYAVVLLSIVAAVLSPPDALSMVLMMIPMLGLYEVGVFAVGYFEKKQQSQT